MVEQIQRRVTVATHSNPDQILWFAEAGATIPELGTPMTDYADEYTAAGLVDEDGFTFSSGIEEGEAINVYPNHEIMRGNATKSPEVSFGLVEMWSPEILELAYNPQDISGEENNYEIRESARVPTNKTIVIEHEIDDDSQTTLWERRIIPNAQFRNKEDEEYDGGNDVTSIDVTYGALYTDGVYSIIQRFPTNNNTGGGEGGTEG